MDFTFLHAADLHLGSPFVGLAGRDEALARRFAAAGRDAFHALVDRALDEEVAFVVIAGDVYDGAWKDTAIGLFFNREVARLARAGIGVFLVAGNHDAASVVTSAIALPERVHRFPTGRPTTVRLDHLRVAVHGLSFARPEMTTNPVPGFPPAEPGWFNVGVLHTSLEGGGEHIRYAPCSLDDLVGRGYDYWALGHVHDFSVRRERPHVVYPGNLQGRSVRECGPKGAVLVDVVDGRVAALRTVHVDRARFAVARLDATGLATADELTAALRAALTAALADVPADRPTAVRVVVSGATALHGALAAERASWRDQAEALAQHLHPEVWLESLADDTAAPAPIAAPAGLSAAVDLDAAALIAAAAADPALRAEAERLAGTIRDYLPAGVALAGDLDHWLARARDLAAARALGADAATSIVSSPEVGDATA
jgi:DNA repair exonuclease SbcCD nuclease subunit